MKAILRLTINNIDTDNPQLVKDGIIKLLLKYKSKEERMKLQKLNDF